VQRLVERAASRVESLGEHIDRHSVEREPYQYFALMFG